MYLFFFAIIYKWSDNMYSPIGSREGSVKNLHPISETVKCKGLHELYKRHVPVFKLKLKQLHPMPQSTLHLRREPVCLFSNGSYIDTLLNNSIFPPYVLNDMASALNRLMVISIQWIMKGSILFFYKEFKIVKSAFD